MRDASAAAVRAAPPRAPDPAERLARVLVSPEVPIDEALARLEYAETGVLLVTDEARRLVAVLTDGDIRRAVLAGLSLGEPCARVACSEPVVGPPALSPAEALRLMDRGREFPVDHLPLVDDAGVVRGLVLRRDLVREEPAPVAAVIMAGGLGTRLRPLTERTPKPMLPVGDRPLLELTIERLRAAGIRRINVTTHYLAERITEHFGDGARFGVDMHYVAEDEPLGTAGALRLVTPWTGPLLVVNGDVLTAVHYRDMLAYHREQRAEVTVGVRQYDMQVPYGVIESEGSLVTAIREKPVQRCLVNAGVYLVEASARELMPVAARCDMPDLIARLLDAGRRVACFPIVEYWLDIGRPADYEAAQHDIRTAKV
jgi:dTDP-glucose pyrophosphorylase